MKMSYLNTFRSFSLKIRIVFFILLAALVTGLLCDLFYENSPKQAIQLQAFQQQLNSKEDAAESTVEKLKSILIHSSVDSLSHFPFENDDISYYVFSKNQLLFWSDNSLEITRNTVSTSSSWQFVQLPNAYCLSKTFKFESTRILALIKLKNNYSYENEELTNSFAKGFSCDKQIQIQNSSKSDEFAVSDRNQVYLFSLAQPKTAVYNEAWAICGLIAFSLAFLILFVFYANFPAFRKKKMLDTTQFIVLSGIVGVLTGLLLYFNIPGLMFANKLFTPFQYASNPFLNSISHLSVLTAYFVSTICLFFFYTKIRFSNSVIKTIILQLFSLLAFVLLYYILSGLIYHSSIQLSIIHFNDFSGLNIWIHLLLLVWGIGLALLFFKTHSRQNKSRAIWIDFIFGILLYFACRFISPEDAMRISISYYGLWIGFYLYFLFPKRKNIYTISALWLLIFSGFLVYNSLVISNKKKLDKYKILAQNIYINGSSENDQMADILLEELDVKISRDKKIAKLLIKKDSVQITNDYLNKTYLRGFWNKYDMRLNVVVAHSQTYNEYRDFILKSGNRIKKTHFYSVTANENNMTYIGQFHASAKEVDSLFFFMEFYPRRNFKSYSFPNLLIAGTTNIQSQLNISIAKYERNRLVFSSGKVEFPAESGWIRANKADFFKTIFNGRKQFVYKPNPDSFIVIAEQELFEPFSHFLYFLYTFLAYFAVCSLLMWIYRLARRKWNYRLGLTAKFQFTFITLLIVSFVGIFFVSVNFIEEKYREQQLANLESKKNYIQKALQDLYYWNQDLNAQNSQALNFDLQDLSYIYHTDVHVYDNHGELIGSSQPLIFNKNLISTRIPPTPFFKTNSNLNQYEHIGKLNYLCGYTDFVNGDYAQIGFISIPQFFSQDEIKNEIESFLSVIIHIYLIIIVLAVLLSLFIGKQLSAPLNILENKLKEMRLGRRNEKIDYSLNDEIGQLVIQYNRTVDELEQSARLLAQSERESAWKSMARQVAHEINNPLTPMKLTIQQLQRTKKLDNKQFDDYFTKSSAMLIEQIDNLSRIAGTFSDFARMPEANFDRIDIAGKLYSVVQLFANNNEHVQINYRGAEKDVFVFADPEQMVQVFNNLLKNAIQSVPEKREGVISVVLKQTANQIRIEIADNGTGIESALQDKLFMPNFTTKSTGMGLGLAITKNIIELTGGTIRFDSVENVGTTFLIELPKAD